MTPESMQKLVGVAVIIFALVIAGSQATYVVKPGERGVRVTLGKVAPIADGEGLALKMPFVTQIFPVSIKQQTELLTAECYTADLQHVTASLSVISKIPEASAVQLLRDFESDHPRIPAFYENLIKPRVTEALKEAAAQQSAELIVQNRETIKIQTLEAAREKLGNNDEGSPLIILEDITLQEIKLSPELAQAIEQKMQQEQEAQKAEFIQREAKIQADTAVIKADGEAKSIRIRGEALRKNPAFLDLQIVEKWDGTSPIVVGGADSANVLIPMDPGGR